MPREYRPESDQEQSTPAMAPEPTAQAPQGDAGSDYPDDAWYCRPVPDRDEQKFQVLLGAMREQYSSPDFNQIALADDAMCRSLTTAPFVERFDPDGLLKFATSIRGPYTFNNKLTIGGISRAKFLLCRERMLAGKVTGHEPDWKKLKDVLPPHLYEVKVRVGIIKE